MLTLHSELKAPINRIPRLPFHIPWLLPIVRPVFNLAGRTKCVEGTRLTTQEHEGVKLFVITPENVQPERALLWLHGGAHLAGKPDHVFDVASQFARELNAIVVVPQYRLAPEHPFPADLEDVFTAWLWLVNQTENRDIPEQSIAICGNSAGAGLAASLVHQIHDLGGTQPAAQVLFYPMLDDRTVLNDALLPLNHYIWNNKANAVAWRGYLSPNPPGADTVPEYSVPARREDLSGLPPMWLGVAGIDLFRDECLTYIDRFKDAGGNCTSEMVEGAPHAFEVLAPEANVSKAFVASALSFAQRTLQ